MRQVGSAEFGWRVKFLSIKSYQSIKPTCKSPGIGPCPRYKRQAGYARVTKKRLCNPLCPRFHLCFCISPSHHLKHLSSIQSSPAKGTALNPHLLLSPLLAGLLGVKPTNQPPQEQSGSRCLQAAQVHKIRSPHLGHFSFYLCPALRKFSFIPLQLHYRTGETPSDRRRIATQRP